MDSDENKPVGETFDEPSGETFGETFDEPSGETFGEPSGETFGEAFGEAVPLEINGELDLHTFSPREIGDLIPTWLAECQKLGLLEVRIVHGKGTGALRKGVHAVLDRLPDVTHYKLGDQASGGWGATRVWLKALPNPPKPS